MALTTDSVGGKGDKADHGANPSTGKADATKPDAASQPGTRSSGKASGAAGSDAKNETGDQAGRDRDHRNVERADYQDMPEKVVAAATSDPEVHKILADQDIAWQNGDAEGVRDANTRLNELGYK